MSPQLLKVILPPDNTTLGTNLFPHWPRREGYDPNYSNIHEDSVRHYFKKKCGLVTHIRGEITWDQKN